MKRPSKPKLQRTLSVLADAFIFLFTGSFSLGGAMAGPAFPAGILAFCILKHSWNAFGRFWLVRVVFLVVCVSYADDLVLIGTLFYRAGGLYAVLLAASVLLGACAGYVRLFDLARSKLTLVVPGIAILFLSLLIIGPESPDRCSEVSRSKGVEMLATAVPNSSIPRFLELSGNEETLYVGYRQRFFRPAGFPLDRIDLNTRTYSQPSLDTGEALGVMVHPTTGSTYAVVIRNPSKDAGRLPEKELMIFDPSGILADRVPLDWGTWHDYYEVLMMDQGQLRILSSPTGDRTLTLRAFRPEKRAFDVVARYESCSIPLIVHHARVGATLYVTAGSSILKRDKFSGVTAIDLEGHRCFRSDSDQVFGNHSIAFSEERGEIYSNGTWSGRIDVLDMSLHVKRSYDVGRVLRALAVDSRRGVGYAPDYVDGILRVFNLNSGKVMGSTFVGRGTRVVTVAKSGRVFLANACGTMEIRTDQITGL